MSFNAMNLTLQLNAVDNMSKTVMNAANNSKRALDSVVERSQKRAAQARSAMFESGMMAAGGVAALAYPLKMAANYEMLRIRMVALTQSQTEGIALYKQTIKLASETPLTLNDVAQGTTRLIGFGRSAKDAIVDIKMLGDVVTLAGGDIQAAMIAYGQSAGEGRVMTRDLTQFVNAGVPIFKMLIDSTGWAEGSIKSMAEQGKITFDVLQKSFEMATGKGGDFENGMKKMSESASGGWVRMVDELGRLADVFGSSVLPMLKEFNEWLIPTIANVAEFFRQNSMLAKGAMMLVMAFTSLAAIGFVLNGVIWMTQVTFGGFTKAARLSWVQMMWNSKWALALRLSIISLGESMILMAANGIYAMITGLGSLTTWFSGATAATWAFTTALLTSPITWIVVAIAALVGWLVAVIAKWDEFGAALSLISPVLAITISFVQSLLAHWRSIVSAFQDGGMIAGLKRIGQVMMDVVLYPLQQLLGLIHKFTGFDWASSAQQSIQAIRVKHNLEGGQSASNAVVASAGAPGGNANIGASSNQQLGLAPRGGGSSSMTIQYSPTVTVGSGVSESDKESFNEVLARHKTDIARMVQEANRSQSRKQFNPLMV